jgi:hypothetical protein
MLYNPYLLRFQLDALWRRGLWHDQRGRNLASCRMHLEAAEAQLACRPRFPWSNPQTPLQRAHRSGYAALCSLTAARVGRPVGVAIGPPRLAQESRQGRTQCDVCGADEAPLTFCNDVFCVGCFVEEAVTMRLAAAYWGAPDDATFHAFDVEAAHRQATDEADRVLRAL